MFYKFRAATSAALIACAATAAFASQANAAGQPGWYFGVEGFGTHPDSATASAPGVPGSNGIPGTPGSDGTTCLLPLDLLGLGVGLGGFCVLGPNVPPTDPTDPTPAIPGVPAQRFTYDFKWGFGGGVTFGYAFEGGFRPELNINYSQADVDTISLQEGFGNADGTPADSSPQKYDGKVKALRMMANAWYDIDLGMVQPYVGGGLGMQQTDTNVPQLIDGKDTTFGFQLGGGVGLLLTDYLTLSLDYRYVDADQPKYRSALGQSLKSEYQSQNVGVSLRYALGTGGSDADGDGVPDRLDKCPNTPPGVTVYSDGCPTDLDRDGVPDYLDKCPGTPAGVQVNADGCPIDSDGDGVADNLDQCPGTPPNTPVGPNGCPMDSDGDGVPDYLDRCPNTQRGIKVDANGCDFRDSDGDGVPDDLDKCPNSPRGQQVGPDGCPLDSDGDGIPDSEDACPNTPPGLKVLPDGCAPVGDCRKPRPGEAVDARGCALDKRFVLRGVKFEFDSDRLTAPAKVILTDVAQTLSAYPEIKLDVEGHTDSLGTDSYNLGLSERRANAVIRYLDTQGVKTQRLKAVGYGESVPIDTNDTEAGRDNNRRVEFKVTE
jgi:OOP family OmpA-OmpF porin